MMDLLQALRCHRTARRLSKYVDMDPSARLSEPEIKQVLKHLAECEKCTETVRDLNKIKSSLRWLGSSHLTDEASLSRLIATLDDLSHRD